MCDYRESRESWEWANLAPYASHSSDPGLSWRRSENDARVAGPNPPQLRQATKHFPDPEANQFPTPMPDLAGTISRFKTAFQLDKERIGSSTAFRRLEYKTQVFVSHEGDHYRTRLTHTLEVNETARFVGQALQLNEDLIDAIALGHDLGHTPFGHAGETVLNNLFREYWPKQAKMEEKEGQKYGAAFYHNVQSVRVVDSLEKGYEWDRRPIVYENDLHNPPVARGRGLDLTWAVREGILKHASRGLRANDVRMYGSDYLMAELDSFQPATLEGQVVEFADEIASIMHDLEDGVRSRLFELSELRSELSKRIREADLEDLLGLTARFVHKDRSASRMQSRIGKMQNLLKEIREGNDCTVGTVLAFLRSVLISNLAEASYSRLIHAMAGSVPGYLKTRDINQWAGPDDLIWLHFEIEGPPGPTATSYCSESWEADPVNRKVTAQTFHRTDNEVVADSEPAVENIRVGWISRTTDPAESRKIIIERQDGKVWDYPLGNVCITFGKSKLVGYDKNLLELRHWLRREFIPDRLHNASVVFRANDKGQRWLDRLFRLYFSTPKIIHRRALERFDMWEMASKSPGELQQSPAFVLRIVEHLQGMTDRYLTEEYTRLFLHEMKMSEPNEICIVDGDQPPFPKREPLNRGFRQNDTDRRQ